MVLGGLARICFPNACSFLIYLWTPGFPFEVPDPCLLLLGPKWHVSLNWPMCPRVPHSQGTPVCTDVMHLVIFSCSSVSWWFEKGEKKLYFFSYISEVRDRPFWLQHWWEMNYPLNMSQVCRLKLFHRVVSGTTYHICFLLHHPHTSGSRCRKTNSCIVVASGLTSSGHSSKSEPIGFRHIPGSHSYNWRLAINLWNIKVT